MPEKKSVHLKSPSASFFFNLCAVRSNFATAAAAIGEIAEKFRVDCGKHHLK